MFPTLGNAAAYAHSNMQKFEHGRHVILAVELDDDAQLAPDHEEYLRLIQQPDDVYRDQQLWDRLRADLDPEYLASLPSNAHADAVAIIERLSPEDRNAAAMSLMEMGEPVAVATPHGLHTIHICELRMIDEAFYWFSKRHPEYDEEELREAFDESLTYKKVLSEQSEFEELLLRGPIEYVDDDLDAYYDLIELREWGIEHGLIDAQPALVNDLPAMPRCVAKQHISAKPVL